MLQTLLKALAGESDCLLKAIVMTRSPNPCGMIYSPVLLIPAGQTNPDFAGFRKKII
jgi:hypothetical protein